jgi:LPXTG-motif cell wall-anchored protein
MMSVMLTPTADNPNGQKWVETNMPVLWGLLTQAMQPGAGEATVLAPYLSLADRTREERAGAGGTTMMSTMAWYGLGAAALLGLALVFRKKR